MKKAISNLPLELVEEILSRVPLTSLSKVRSTSKQWNALSKERIVCKAKPKQQFLGFLVLDCRVYSVRINLQSNLYGGTSVKKIGKFDHFMTSSVFHCDGLVLCLAYDYSGLVAWNPYLGQTRLIQAKTRLIRPRNVRYTNQYGLGYDSSHTYKILRVSFEYFKTAKRRIEKHEIYDFDSDSWRSLDVTPGWSIGLVDRHGISLKGNGYWCAFDEGNTMKDRMKEDKQEDFLLCFNFTRERFGPRLELPTFRDHLGKYGTLACVREEKLAILFKDEYSRKGEIWLTTKIEPEFVSWSKFLVLDMSPGQGLRGTIQNGRYFIDEEKKVAWLFDYTFLKDDVAYEKRHIAYKVGENGYYREVDLGEPPRYTPVGCSYVPSLVQI